MIDDKKVFISGVLTLIVGILHIFIGVLAIGLLELSVTLFIFSIFLLFISLRLITVMRNNPLDEKRRIIISCATGSFLNVVTMLTHIIIASPNDRLVLYFFLFFFIAIGFYNFLIFFIKKIQLDQMDNDDKLSYFTIVILRGLGLGLLFNVLAWIGISGDLNPIMITYILIFGTLNTIFGEQLYSKNDVKKIQMRALIVLILGLVFETILVSFFPNPKSLVDIILYSVIIPVRIYYIKKKF